MATLRLAMAIDANNPVIGDIYITPEGTTRLTESLSEEVQQTLYLRFSFFLGEWFLEPSAGTPWLQKILGVKQTDDVVANILRSVISTTPGVAAITSFALNRTGRAVAPRFACTLTDGSTLVSSNVPFILPAGVG